MATVEDDPIRRLTDALAGTAPPPVDLVPRVFVRWTRAVSPTGDVLVAFTEQGVCYLRTDESVGGSEHRFQELLRDHLGRPLQRVPRLPGGVGPALRSGRAGRVAFDLRSLPVLGQSVLRAVTRIPVGETRPYHWLAEQVSRPDAVRAVGAVLARNPVPLLIPCHRVVRADGGMGGHVLGPDVKERLLRWEGTNLDEVRDLAAERVFYLGSDTTNIVCFPTCHNARRITGAHRRGFRSVDAALEAGYRPCRACRPAAHAS